MKARRLIPVMLALCIVAALIPALATGARAAANDPTYIKYGYPEVAVLNGATGGNTDFYTGILKDSKYNAVEAGKFGNLRYKTEVGKNSSYTWSGFWNTNLALLSDQTDELRVNYSATLRNYFHEHSWGFLGWYSQKVTGRMTTSLSFTPEKSGGKYYYAVQLGDGSSTENVRKNNMKYTELPPVLNGNKTIWQSINGEHTWDFRRSDAILSFSNMSTLYDSGNKTCTCGGYVSGCFVGFYDGQSPTVRKVETRRNGAACTDFKPGDDIEIVLQFSEPVRFADDSASGKGEVYIALLVNGSTTPLYAQLTKLESSGYYSYDPYTHTRHDAAYEATFVYHVPSDFTGLKNITALDLSKAPSGKSALVHTTADLSLVQVRSGGNFTVSKPSSATNRNGFDRATSYITDIAGNSLVNGKPATNFSIDAEKPFVAKVVIDADMKNSSIKDYKRSQGIAEDSPFWADLSDSNLGVNDTFLIKVYMNEVINYSSYSNVATVTTNLLDSSDNPVTVTMRALGTVSADSVGTQYGLGASNGRVTLLESNTRTVMQPGMHLADGATSLKVTSITYQSNTTDHSGNQALENQHLNSAHKDKLSPVQTYSVDTDGPTVTVDPAIQNGVNSIITVPFTVTDGADGSGTRDMVGRISFKDPGKTTPTVECAVSIYAAPPTDNSAWVTVKSGEDYSFRETETVQYLHIRMIDGEFYNFGGLTVDFVLSDYAGNSVKRTERVDGVSFDTLGPYLTQSSPSRQYDNLNTRGVITVPVQADDPSGIYSFFYLWADDPEIVYSSTSDEWLPVPGFTQGQTAARCDLTVYVPDQTNFAKTLWLKAVDPVGNETIQQKSRCYYNLQSIKYALSYPTEVVESPYLQVTELNTSKNADDSYDILLFDIQKGDDPHHYLLWYTGSGQNGTGYRTPAGSYDSRFDNILYRYAWFEAVTGGDNPVPFGTRNDDGNLQFGTADHPLVFDNTATQPYLDMVTIMSTTDDRVQAWGKLSGSDWGLEFNGELHVTVYSGTTDSIKVTVSADKPWQGDDPDLCYATVSGAADKEEFTIRVMPMTNRDTDLIWQITADEGIFTYHNTSIHNDYEYGYDYYGNDPETYGTNTLNHTLGGYQVTFSIQDKRGWDLEDIDWSNSFIALGVPSGQVRFPSTINRKVNGHTDNQINDYGPISDYIPYKLCPIGSGATQTITLPYESDLYKTGNYDREGFGLVLARYSVPEYPYYIPIGEEYKQFMMDLTEPGTLEPGLLSYRPIIDYFNVVINHEDVDYVNHEFEFSTAFPAQLINYDPADVIYVPASGAVSMMFQVLDANGDPAKDNWLDTHFGLYDVVAWNVSDPDNITHLNQSVIRYDSTDPDAMRGYFEYCFTADDDGNVTELKYAAQDYGQYCLNFTIDGQRTLRSYSSDDDDIEIESGKDNLIAVQVKYYNGKSSDPVYLTIHPVSITGVTGTVTSDPELTGWDTYESGAIVDSDITVSFTPDDGVSTAGLTFYLCKGFYQAKGKTYATLALTDPVPMEMNGDGTYTAELTPVEMGYEYSTCPDVYYSKSPSYLTHYVVCARDAVGNIVPVGGPGYALIADGDSPYIGYADGETADGRFSVKAGVTDASLFANVGKESDGTVYLVPCPISDPLTFTVTFDDEYTALLGAAETAFTFQYDPVKAYNEGNVEFESNGYNLVVTYPIPVPENPFGITSVTSVWSANWTDWVYGGVIDSGLLELTIEGILSPKLESPTDVTMYISAADPFGNTTEGTDKSAEALLENAQCATPHFVSAEYRNMGKTQYEYQGDMALYVTFSGPVKPEASWICPDPQGYSTEWADGFPIWKDGTWTITYYDVFNNKYEEEITLTDVFGIYGIELEISETAYTTDPVTISVKSDVDFFDSNVDKLMLFRMNDNPESIPSVRSEWQAQVEVTENGDYMIYNYHGSAGFYSVYSDLSAARKNSDQLIIHVKNVITGGPEETLMLFFHDRMEDFVAGSPEQPTGEVDDAVTVSYRTDRDTTPVGSAETSKTFHNGDDDSFEFTYHDDVTDADFTIRGKLSDYGVILVAPEEPVADTTAPVIKNVSIWKQIGPSFKQAEAFTGNFTEAQIAETFSENRTGWARGYDLVLSVSDESKWKLVLCSSEPAALSYTSENASIPGVSVQGNSVLVTPELTSGEFWIAAVDESGNFSYMRFSSSWFHLDGGVPVIESSVPDLTNLYEATVYIKVTDDHSGADQITVTGEGLEANTGSNSAEYPYLIRFTKNTTGEGIPVSATDAVGNTSIKYITVSGIDETASELTVTWTPCFRSEVTGVLDETSPTEGPVNTSIIAHITSSKPISDVSGTVTVSNPDYSYSSQSNIDRDDPWAEYAYYSRTDWTVDVYFTNSFAYVDSGSWSWIPVPVALDAVITVTAPNGAESSCTLHLSPGAIDTMPPDIADGNIEYLHRLDDNGDPYPVAYGFEVELKFDEDAYLVSGDFADPGKLIKKGEVFSYTSYENRDYSAVAMDKAGNRSQNGGGYFFPNVLQLSPPADQQDPVDGVAPALSVIDEKDLPLFTANPVTVNIRIDDNGDIFSAAVDDTAHATIGSITEETDGNGVQYRKLPVTVSVNGNYTLTVIDTAGNESKITFAISSIDLTLPTVRFATSTVSLRQDSTQAALRALLDYDPSVVFLWDNVDSLSDLVTTLTYDDSGVDLTEPGIYEVTYTVTDSTGHDGTATRYVRVISKLLPEIKIDGILTEYNGTLGMKPGTHTIEIGNLGIANEPYKIKLIRGIWSVGQMKYVNESVAVNDDGTFTLTGEGFYTLYILTQSRVGYITTIYVEN
ncbi:MAG: hypothetical protein IJU57_07030 [Clostridia bacterium]|nr:hypothetical protein [Clostridia bacterium]